MNNAVPQSELLILVTGVKRGTMRWNDPFLLVKKVADIFSLIAEGNIAKPRPKRITFANSDLFNYLQVVGKE